MSKLRRNHRATTPGRRAGPSGRFVLRIEPGLHEALRTAARACDLSLNDYCARRLAAPASECGVADAAHALARAASLFGDVLVGIVAFGSWVRGEAGTTSDVDLLVVLETRVPLTRDLYRRWDETPVTWDGHRVEPHFVHLPDSRTVTGGAWAEAAIDGVVIFERRFSVSQRLAAVRRHVLSGRLVRRVVHGQPYWAEVA